MAANAPAHPTAFRVVFSEPLLNGGYICRLEAITIESLAPGSALSAPVPVPVLFSGMIIIPYTPWVVLEQQGSPAPTRDYATAVPAISAVRIDLQTMQTALGTDCWHISPVIYTGYGGREVCQNPACGTAE